jgi:hypothetical protein
MKQNTILVVMSLLSIVLFSFHLADDIVRGFEPGQLWNLTALPTLVVWLYGTLALAERRSGYIIVFVASLLGLGVPFLHMRGKGVGLEGRIAHTDGAFFFVWTLIALGVTALFSLVLSARGLWSLRRGQGRKSVAEIVPNSQPHKNSCVHNHLRDRVIFNYRTFEQSSLAASLPVSCPPPLLSEAQPLLADRQYQILP